MKLHIQTLIGAVITSPTLTIHIDDDLKREASEVADYYGLDFSSVTRAFCRQMVNSRRILLTFAPEEPNAESLVAIREGDAFLASGKGALCQRCRPRRGGDDLMARLIRSSRRPSRTTSKRRQGGAIGASSSCRSSLTSCLIICPSLWMRSSAATTYTGRRALEPGAVSVTLLTRATGWSSGRQTAK